MRCDTSEERSGRSDLMSIKVNFIHVVDVAEEYTIATELVLEFLSIE